MGEIKRFNYCTNEAGGACWASMEEEPNGEYVLHSDHEAAIREKDAEIERYRQAIWDARSILGFDNDGDPTPESVTYPHLADLLRRAEAQRDALLAAGAPLANAAYNLAQMSKLGEHERASLDASCQRWDKEVDGIRQQGT